MTAVIEKVKRRSPRGNWLVVTYRGGKISFCTWVQTWAGVQMSKRAAEKYLLGPSPSSKVGRVIVMDIERMADFAVTEAANEIHDLYRLFEKS
jgi:hypothetical protein